MSNGEVNSLRGDVVPDDEGVGLTAVYVFLSSPASSSSGTGDSGRKPPFLVLILIL